MKPFIAAIQLTALFILASSPAPARSPDRRELMIPLLDNPFRDAVYFQPGQMPDPRIDPDWTVRTGIKKGILDRASALEQTAGPDAAVLKRGFYDSWPSLLAEFREPSVLVDVKRIAGLARTKPYLIIPTGALRGLSRSKFFKAGLAEYAGAGGVILCFAQRDGEDLTALPMPAGSAIEAAGWNQDAGPFFRASSVQAGHPMLAGTGKTMPDVGTSGYLKTLPAGSKVILARSDGYATLVLYPYGSGWVIVTTLFTDHAYDQGHLSADEKVLVRNLVYWAKAPSQIVEASPGDQLKLELLVQGPEQSEAASIKFMVTGNEDSAYAEEIVNMAVKPNAVLPVTLPYTVPVDLPPGIYHIEYVLLDSAGKALSARAESGSGRFSIGHPPIAPPVPRLPQPHPGNLTRMRVQPALQGSGASRTIKFTIIPDARAGDADQHFFINAAGQEKSFELAAAPQSVVFTVPEQAAERRLSYILCAPNGRSLLRGILPVGEAATKDITLDKPSATTGQKILITTAKLGTGEFHLMAPGQNKKMMMTGAGNMPYPVPANLPGGTYRVTWRFTPIKGPGRQGEFPLLISGYRVRFLDASFEHKPDRESRLVTVRLKIHSTRTLAARVKLRLVGPDDKIIPAAEVPITLTEGEQEVPFTFSFKPGSAGIWELQYSIEARLPDGPGLTKEPVVLASDQTLFDIGETALLGVATAKPVYYDPSSPVELIAFLNGAGRAKIELFVDNKKIGKEKMDLAGSSTYTTTISDPGPGLHTLKAVVSGDELESSEEHQFITGARFPDLVVTVHAPEPEGLMLPVSIEVRNQGKAASGPSTVALYDGDPAQGGTRISTSEVPSLDPGRTHRIVIDWLLAKKAGTRMLIVTADANNAVLESDERNNRASVAVTVPDLLFLLSPLKRERGTDEELAYSLRTINLSTTTYKDLVMRTALLNSAGKAVFSETDPVPELAPGTEKLVERRIRLETLPQGNYTLKADVGQKTPLASVASEITILPTLMLQGRLDGTPQNAGLCLPFRIQFSVKNTGNLPLASGGTLMLEFRNAATGQVVRSRQLPLVLETASFEFGKMDLPKGNYLVALKASATSKDRRTAREFSLDERQLTVTSPVIARKGAAVIPRILLWTGKTGIPVQQALIDKIAKQSLEEESVYSAIVNNAEDFASRAETGLFNTYVLFEIDEMIDARGLLFDRVAAGQGLVMIGAGARIRTIAEAYGFSLSDAPSTTAMLTFTKESGSGLSGSLPVSGRMLVPKKKGAIPAALFADTGTPAALIDRSGKGTVLVLPFSLSSSALDTGASSLYSLLLRTAIRNAAPEIEEQSTVSLDELAVSTPGGQIKARIVVSVPNGSRIIWANAGGSIKSSTITFEVTLSEEALRLLFLYRPPAIAGNGPAVDISYECDGTFTGQGRME